MSEAEWKKLLKVGFQYYSLETYRQWGDWDIWCYRDDGPAVVGLGSQTRGIGIGREGWVVVETAEEAVAAATALQFNRTRAGIRV